MLIDKSHKPWAVFSALILAVAVVVYVPSALGTRAPSGGSIVGLVYGIVGFGFMAFVTLLSLRKKFPIWRIGRTQSWMRGHLWLGALSLPLILLHAGLLFGHGLTSILMWLFVVVYASGVFGAYLQHTMPRRIMRDVPMETIYDQIGHVREQLLDEGDTVVADACGSLQVEVPVAASGAVSLASVIRVAADDTAPLREFYVGEMRAFLQAPTRTHALANETTAAARFSRLRGLVQPALAGALSDLENICDEERQLLRQEKMHGRLHAWLVVHVPLSFALMALAVVHIVMALRF